MLLHMELCHTGGDAMPSEGKAHQVTMHTSAVIIPTNGIVCEVEDNITVHAYVSPGGGFAT